MTAPHLPPLDWLTRLLQGLRMLVVALALLWTVAWRMADAYPPWQAIQPALYADPVQTPATAPTFEVSHGDVRYRITPRADYTLHGLVVSAHDTDAWWDLYHEIWGDTLNVKDLCIIWGDNLRPEVLERVQFSNTSYTCWARWARPGRGEEPLRFSGAHFSNNHLLTADPAIQQTLRRAGKGDQIRITGQLVEYSNGPDFSRGTSLSRTDEGMGACETIFIHELDVLAEAAPFWRDLLAASRAGALACLGLWGMGWVYYLIREEPVHAPGDLHQRAVALASRGRYRQACALLSHALQLDPTLAQAYADRAICLDALGEYEQAARDRALATHHAPESTDPHDPTKSPDPVRTA